MASSDSTLLRRIEAQRPAAYAVIRARLEAALARGWTIREDSGGYIAELDNRRGIFAVTLADLTSRQSRKPFSPKVWR